MRESRADTQRALLYAVALHALMFALMFAGLWWTRSAAPLSAAGSPIEAELVDPDALSARMKRALASRPEPVPPQPAEEAAPEPQPLPEPVPEDSPVERQVEAQESLPIPDDVQQEEVRRDAISAETREREQEEKRLQEQVDLTERERQEEVEQRERLAQQQREEKLKQIRAERARLQREANLSEERLKQLADRRAQSASEAAAQSDADASAQPPPGNEGVDAGLAARYAAAIQEAIRSKWTRPETVPIGQRCRINIRQLPGGEVIDVSVSASCPYDEAGRRSVEAAVLKAQPLPYAGFESVFNRNLNLNFQAGD